MEVGTTFPSSSATWKKALEQAEDNKGKDMWQRMLSRAASRSITRNLSEADSLAAFQKVLSAE